MTPLITLAAALPQEGSSGFLGGLLGLLYLGVIVLMIASMWKVFTKAGQDGWKAIIPIYNLYVLLKIVGRPGWWLILFLVPIVNFIVAIVLNVDLAKSFGKGIGYGLGLTFLGIIFYPLLGFGDAEYQGPAAASGQMQFAA
jgi:hypothetical protein